MTTSVSLGILGLSVPSGTHICTFFRGPAERDEIVVPYLAEGLRAKDKCLYDLDSCGAEVLMDVLRTHPMVVVDGMVHDNPYYVEPGKFVADRG